MLGEEVGQHIIDERECVHDDLAIHDPHRTPIDALWGLRELIRINPDAPTICERDLAIRYRRVHLDALADKSRVDLVERFEIDTAKEAANGH